MALAKNAIFQIKKAPRQSFLLEPPDLALNLNTFERIKEEWVNILKGI